MQHRQLLPQNKRRVRGAQGPAAPRSACPFCCFFFYFLCCLLKLNQDIGRSGECPSIRPGELPPPNLCFPLPSWKVSWAWMSVVPGFSGCKSCNTFKGAICDLKTVSSSHQCQPTPLFWFDSAKKGPRICLVSGKMGGVCL